MKKRERVIFIILLLLCLFFPINKLSADSGWDGGYDSGGSSWSGGSSDWGSSSSDWGSSSSDWSSSSGSHSSGSLDLFTVISILIFMAIIFAITNKPNSGSNRLMVPGTSLSFYQTLMRKSLKKKLMNYIKRFKLLGWILIKIQLENV